jgi:hypothetical protein
MGSILNDADRTAICQRIGSVTSASVPRWGRMDARAMLNHLRLSALMALGELPVANKSKRAEGRSDCAGAAGPRLGARRRHSV